MTENRTRALLALILALYAILGTLYAIYTPAWEAPDEPAHYNYVRYVAQNRTFPVLQPGDYPAAYLDQIKDAKFPPSMSIDTIRYESHQPPLFYALAAPIFLATGGALLPLRLFSVVLGAVVVGLAYRIGRRIFPGRPGLALGAASFVAFLPRHLASVAQVENDTLIEVLLALVLVVLIERLWPRPADAWAAATGRLATGRRGLLLLGLLLGLIAITKTTGYFAFALIMGVVIWEWWRARAGAGRILADLCLLALPAAVLALPWYVRDISVYGWPDFLGLGRHDAIVAGQLRTADYLAQIGLPAYLRAFAVTTFESFWAVFGWMGVFLDERIYQALAIFSAVVAGGLLLHERTVRQPAALASGQRYALRLLAVTSLLTFLVYLWYNQQFVQFQGRYLFTALIPVAVAFGLGWDAVLHPPSNARWLAAGLAVVAVIMAAVGVLVAHNLPKWPLAMAVAGAALLFVRPWLPRRLDGVLFALPYAVLPLFALYSLFLGIVPQLAR